MAPRRSTVVCQLGLRLTIAATTSARALHGVSDFTGVWVRGWTPERIAAAVRRSLSPSSRAALTNILSIVFLPESEPPIRDNPWRIVYSFRRFVKHI
jgi:hypothetical protein